MAGAVDRTIRYHTYLYTAVPCFTGLFMRHLVGFRDGASDAVWRVLFLSVIFLSSLSLSLSLSLAASLSLYLSLSASLSLRAASLVLYVLYAQVLGAKHVSDPE